MQLGAGMASSRRPFVDGSRPKYLSATAGTRLPPSSICSYSSKRQCPRTARQLCSRARVRRTRHGGELSTVFAGTGRRWLLPRVPTGRRRRTKAVRAQGSAVSLIPAHPSCSYVNMRGETSQQASSVLHLHVSGLCTATRGMGRWVLLHVLACFTCSSL
jgi:hypothetical protein